MSKLDKIEELQSILKEDPSNFPVRRQLAVLLLDTGYAKEALQHFLYLSQIFQKDSGIFYNLGITYEKLKELDKAENAYLKAFEYAPEEVDAMYNLGLVYIEKKEYNKAIQCFDKVLESDANDSNSYFNIGIANFKKGDLIEAMDNFQHTVDLNDEDIYAHFYIGNIFKEFGDNDSAREKFQKVLEISPDYSWAYYNLGVIDFEEGNIKGALYNLEKTLELNPKDIEAYEIYIKIITKSGDYQRANDLVKTALKNCGSNGDLFYIYARIKKLMNDNDAYIKYLNKALENNDTLSVAPKIVKTEIDKFLAQ